MVWIKKIDMKKNTDTPLDRQINSLEELVKYVNSTCSETEVVALLDYHEALDDKLLPSRFNAFILILCKKGSGRIGIDLGEYDLKPGTLVTIHPNNFISLMEVSDDFCANIVGCSLRVVEEVLPKLTDLLPLIVYNRTDPVAYLSMDQSSDLNVFFHLLHDKIHEKASPFLHKKVMCLLQAALFEIMEIHYESPSDSMFSGSRREEIMARFIILVSEKFRLNRQVSFYADKLSITPKHLSSVVKSISGVTAGEWIEKYVVMEAKLLLKSTDMTVQEIALDLNFANQSFFGKYFKHLTGETPTAYRRRRNIL